MHLWAALNDSTVGFQCLGYGFPELTLANNVLYRRDLAATVNGGSTTADRRNNTSSTGTTEGAHGSDAAEEPHSPTQLKENGNDSDEEAEEEVDNAGNRQAKNAHR